MDGGSANDALEGFNPQMKGLPSSLRESPAHDRGGELACQSELSRRLKLNI
jgi:IS30 family transposase